MPIPDLFHEIEIEPDEPPRLTLTPELLLPPALPVEDTMALTRSLPENFNLRVLLQFLPDPKLKQRADALAAAACAIQVTGAEGLKAADTALGKLRTAVSEIETCFAEPTSLANALHKRLTGLRTDFCANGQAALEIVGRRVYDENKRLAAEDAAERRRRQEVADQQARASAQQAVAEAKQYGVPDEVVHDLEKAAAVTTAPPVAPLASAPALKSTTTSEKWKARFHGTPAEAEPNPDVADLSPFQLVALKELLTAVVEGKEAPASVVKTLNWGYLNKRAEAEKTTLTLPGLEAFDAGSVRAKRKGRM